MNTLAPMSDGVLLSSCLIFGGLAYFVTTTFQKKAGLDPAVAVYINEPIERQKRARQSLMGMAPDADQFANIMAEQEEIRQLALLDKTQLYVPEEAYRTPAYTWREDVTPNYNNH